MLNSLLAFCLNIMLCVAHAAVIHKPSKNCPQNQLTAGAGMRSVINRSTLAQQAEISIAAPACYSEEQRANYQRCQWVQVLSSATFLCFLTCVRQRSTAEKGLFDGISHWGGWYWLCWNAFSSFILKAEQRRNNRSFQVRNIIICILGHPISE